MRPHHGLWGWEYFGILSIDEVDGEELGHLMQFCFHLLRETARGG